MLSREISDAISVLGHRDQKVALARLGFSGRVSTLSEIGARLGVTRERARQIERRALGLIVSHGNWRHEMNQRLSSLFVDRNEPVFVDMLEAEDEWFAGFGDRLVFLAVIIKEFSAPPLQAWDLNGRMILSSISKSEFKDMKRSVLATIHAHGPDLTSSDRDLIIEAATEHKNCGELKEYILLATPTKKKPIRPDIFDRNSASGAADYHALCLQKLESRLSSVLHPISRTTYESPAGLRVFCAVSKRYESSRGTVFWYAFHKSQYDYLAQASSAYVAFGCGSADRIVMIPFATFREWILDMNTTTRSDGRFYWHVHIYETPTTLQLGQRRGVARRDLSSFVLEARD